jgi:hypothetical protein
MKYYAMTYPVKSLFRAKQGMSDKILNCNEKIDENTLKNPQAQGFSKFFYWEWRQTAGWVNRSETHHGHTRMCQRSRPRP